MKKWSLLLTCILAVAACGRQGDDDDDASPSPSETQSPAPSPTPNFALSFDGVDDFAVVDGSGGEYDTFGSAITIEAWVNLDPSATSSAVLIGQGDEPPGFGGGYFLLAAAQIVISTPSTDNSGTVAVTPGQWHHIAGSYDGTTMRAYIDGVEVISNDHPSPGPIPSGVNYLSFGTFSTGRFTGLIDEVRLWNVVRTDTQILQNYDQPVSGSSPGLVGYWNFNSGTGQTVVNRAGAGLGLDARLGSTTGTDAEDPLWVDSVAPVKSD